jgi:hypothetical protein
MKPGEKNIRLPRAVVASFHRYRDGADDDGQKLANKLACGSLAA